MNNTKFSNLDTHNFIPKEVEFESEGYALKGYLFKPPGAGPFPCVINNHGSNLRPNSSMVSRPGLAALHMEWGYAFFFPHRRGYGHSPGLPVKKAIPATLGSDDYDKQIVCRLDYELNDVMAAISCMRSRTEIDSLRIAVSGSSRGGILSLLAAAKDDKICASINFSGGARQWARHSRLRAKILTAASSINQYIFLAQTENDFNRAATLELSDELTRLKKDHICRIYPPWGYTLDEGHMFELNGSAIWGPDIQQFLRLALE